MAWYGIRSVVDHRATGGHLYEERVVLFDAADEATAFRLAEGEAAEYCAELEGATPLAFYQLYNLADGAIESGSEVFSLMRTDHLEPSAYLDRFFDTGDELQRH